VRFTDPAWHERPFRTTLRVAASLVLRRIPSRRDAVVRFDGGRSLLRADLSTALGLGLYRYGVSDPDLELVGRLLSPGDVFVDGGANVGVFTVVAAARVGPSGRVIAFEPAARTRQKLSDNVRLNGFDWVSVRPEALGDRTGSATMVTFAGDGAGLSSFAPESTRDGIPESVSVACLDDILGQILGRLDDARLKLIKLDLEGSELRALEGASRLLSSTRPDLLVEVEPPHLVRQGDSAAALLELLLSRGYALYKTRRLDAETVGLTRETRPELGGRSPNVFASAHADRLERAGVRLL
jgi:FkbM family methyltransferase